MSKEKRWKQRNINFHKAFLQLEHAVPVDQINSELNEELPLPYMFDILEYRKLADRALADEIDSTGKELYKKGNYSAVSFQRSAF